MSPLLRLPGELRNRIYHYVFKGLHVAVVTVDNFDPYVMQLHTGYRARAWQNPSSDLKQPKAFLGLTQACRQVHAEIGVLHLKLLTLHMTSEWNDGAVLDRLSKAQRAAIHTVTVDGQRIQDDLRNYQWIRKRAQRKPHDFTLQVCADTSLHDFTRRTRLYSLPGLKRVEVENWSRREGKEEEILVGILRHCANDREIEVIFQGQT